MRTNVVRPFLLCTVLFGIVFALLMPRDALAGVYDDETGATYLQVWVDHREFTGGCGDHATNGYSWYVEPEGYFNQECPKILDFTLPDDLSNVTKIEIYLDIWRGHNPPSVRFSINDVRNYASPVGASWSRTPLVMELNKADFQPGDNTIRVWKGTNRYHIHDIGFRLYYNEGAPILSGVAAPSARLASIAAGATSLPADQGGALNIDGDRVTVTVDNVSGNTDFVEVYAFYEGYDEDNDGIFRDWHNRTRNNCQQGGAGGRCPGNPETGLFGTIDHVGTIPTTGSSPYSLDWNIPYVAGQSGVRFKLRAVDIDIDVNDDNKVDNNDDGELVRDAAGGVSAEFDLQRTKAVTTFLIPNFQDAVLHHDGQYPDVVERFIDLPPDVNTYDQAYLLGSFWRTPRIALNSGSAFRAFETGEDDWALSIRSINVGQLQAGQNKITYSYTGGFGQFIEAPGPMVVLRRTSAAGSDSTAPWIHREAPARNAQLQNPGVTVELQLYDSQSGVNLNTLEMRVDGAVVSPEVTGDRYNYRLRYTPSAPLPRDRPITVAIDVQDGSGNRLVDSYSFNVDGQGPVISNLTCVRSSNDEATVSWKTNELATGRVNFGPANDLSSVANAANAALLQSVALTGLSAFPETRYQVTAIDIYGNESTAAEALCPQDAVSILQSDDFNRCTLDTEIWTYINPRNDATLSADGSELRIDVPGGQSHDVWTGGNFAPRIMQAANNVDFSVDVKFLTSVTQGVQLQGLLVEQDADDFLRFNVQAEGGQVKVLGVDFNNGSPSVKFNRTLGITPVNQPIYMRLIRSGVTWQLLYSFDGFDWQNGGSLSRSLEVSAVGLFAGNAGSNAPAYTSIVDYFFRTDAPIEPEDGFATYFSELTVATTPNGVGAVTGGPAESTGDDPLCGTPLKLTAEPVPGWRLGEWQIVAADQPDQPRTAEENPLIEQFLRSDSITAVFLQNHYELTLNVIDETGASASDPAALVAVTPPLSQEGYLHNETATLTASDAGGWYFNGWSGDLTGANRVETVTFTGNVNVTANYLRRYALDVAVVDEAGAALDVNGVTVSPPADPRGYAPGEVATLSAVPAPGWRFVGWSNELGTELEVSFPMTEDVTVQATFARERYTVSATAVDADGNALPGIAPTVSPASDPAGYIYDEVVTLTTPESADGRMFLRWEWTGDAERISEPTATAQFKVRGNTAFRAIYAENSWTLTIGIVEGNGSVETRPDGNRFLDGEEVTLTAVPDSGWKFAGWSGDVPPAERDLITITLVMDADKTVQARFALGELPTSIYLPVIRN